jgi:signal transduction histidine kinase
MSKSQRSFELPAREIRPEPVATIADRKAAHLADPWRGALRFELIAFLLLVATFAAILFKDAIVERRFSLNPATIAQYVHYWYADDTTNGGKSTASGSQAQPERWTCDLRAGFAYPFCASGLILDVSNTGAGRDFSRYQKMAIRLDYRGPSRRLKIAFKNAERGGKPGDEKVNTIQFPVVPGYNDVRLDQKDVAVEQWWAFTHRDRPGAGRPDLHNVVAIDVMTGDGAALGHHQFALRGIELSGSSVSAEHWYLILLGSWTGLAALYLIYRVTRLKRAYAHRQQVLIEESQLLEEARDAAESASHAKSRFLAHMSHELRTPLNAILGYAQLLKGTQLDERQAGAARTIEQSGEHLLSLITDILDLSKIEAGKLELAPAPIDLRLMVRGVADMIALRAQEKDIAFHWAVAPDVPRGVVGDEKCLRQVLINILGNAVKFTPSGEVRLQLGLLTSAGGDVRLRFEVRDTGVGIPPDRLERIFEPFEQAGDKARRAGGTGLGLSISRRIVELMNGRIQVESTLGIGSLFRFDVTLPLADNSALPAPPTEEQRPAAPLPSRRHSFDAVPTGHCMERLHDLALAGNMRAIRAEAERQIERDPATAAFAGELLALARSYQSQAILELIEKNKSESMPV